MEIGVLDLGEVGGALALRACAALATRRRLGRGARASGEALVALERGEVREGVAAVSSGWGWWWRFCSRVRVRSGLGWVVGVYESFPVFAGELDRLCEEFDRVVWIAPLKDLHVRGGWFPGGVCCSIGRSSLSRRCLRWRLRFIGCGSFGVRA